MKKLLLFVFLFVTACGSSDKKEETPKEIYSLVELEYYAASGQGIITNTETATKDIGTNNTSGEMTASIQPYKDLVNTSLFRLTPTPDMIISNEEKFLSIPLGILDNEIVLDGDKEWLFSPNMQQGDAYSNAGYTTPVTIPPHSRSQIILTVVYSDITLSFNAKLVGKDSGKEVTLQGVWTGRRVQSADHRIEVSDL